MISSLVGKTPEAITFSFIFDEIYRLARKGIDVHVIRPRMEEDSFSYEIHFHGLERKIDTRTAELALRNLRTYPLISLLRNPRIIYREIRYALNVTRVTKKYNIKLLHAHFAYPEGLIGLLAKKEVRKPLIVTLHGSDILVEPSIGYGARLSRRINTIISKVINSAEAIVTASKATFNEAKKLLNDESKLHLIYNGVDTQRFNPHINSSFIKEELKLEDKTVVFALRFHEPQYGLEYLIRAIPMVAKEQNDVIFIIGGDGSLRRYHEQLAAKLNIKGKIIFTGKIPRSKVPYYYAMSDVVVVPSLQEAFGLVVSEAMACGKPVIGTRVGGIPDQIIDGYNGFLVQPKSPNEIADKILWLINNPKEAKRMGMNGRKVVMEKFDINKRIDKIIALYHRLLEDR